jgi:intracellular multiplication protein IcmP
METGGGPRDPYDGFWLFGAILGAPMLVWWAWSDQIVLWIVQIKLVELWLIDAAGLGSAWTAELAGALRGALTAPEQISFDALAFGLEAVGLYLSGPVAAGLALLGGGLMLFHPAGRYRRRFDLAGLAEAMKEQWPFALHALRRGNLKLPLDHPTWGVALSGWMFLRRHDLLVSHTTATDPSGWALREAPAQGVLAEQLGRLWGADPRSGPPVPPHARALAGIFALRVASFAVEDDEDAERLKDRTFALLRRLALAAANHPDGDYLPPAAAYESVIQDTAAFLHADVLQRIIARHAYTQTVLLRLLAEARQGGVLPSSLFNWLKGVDRPLWYALCSLGRRTPFVEALGAVAHYQAERSAGIALYAPVVGAAIEGLQRELQRIPPESIGTL